MKRLFSDLFYKEFGVHRNNTIDVNDCHILNSEGLGKITRIKGFYNKHVIGLEIFYMHQSLGPKIGDMENKGMQKVEFDLFPNEEIIQINGNSEGDIINDGISSLIFITSLGRNCHIGKISHKKTFSLETNGMMIRQIKFGISSRLDYIGARFFKAAYVPNSDVFLFKTLNQRLAKTNFEKVHFSSPLIIKESLDKNILFKNGDLYNIENQLTELYKTGHKTIEDFQVRLQELLSLKAMHLSQSNMNSSHFDKIFPFNIMTSPLNGIIPNEKSLQLLQSDIQHEKSIRIGAEITQNCKTFDDYKEFVLGHLRQNKAVEIINITIRASGHNIYGIEIEYKVSNYINLEEFTHKILHKGTFKGIFVKHYSIDIDSHQDIKEIQVSSKKEIDAIFFEITSTDQDQPPKKVQFGKKNADLNGIIRVPEGKKIVAFGGSFNEGLVNIYAYY